MNKKLVFITVLILLIATLSACKKEELTCDEGYKIVDDQCVIVKVDDKEDPVVEPEPEMTYDYGVLNGDFEFNMKEWEYYTLDGFHDIITSEYRSEGKSLQVENSTSVYTSIWQTIDLGDSTGPLENDFVQFEGYFKGTESTTGTVQLIVENVINDSTKIVIAQSEKTALTSEWASIMTSVGEIPTAAVKINIVMIFETTDKVFVDDMKLTKTTSNNAALKTISLDSEVLDTFTADITDYTIYLPTDSYPTVTATTEKTDSTVLVTQATSETKVTTLLVTAADGTTKTYTITYKLAGTTDLKFIKLNDQEILGFDASKTEYYIVLDSTNLPVITTDTFYEETSVTVSTLALAPGEVIVTVTNGTDTKEYTITFAVQGADTFALPNFDFEADFDWQTWSGTTTNPEASNEMPHSGVYSLKTMHQSSIWKELEFSTTTPSIGDAVTIGAWVYIASDAPSYDFKIKIVGYTESTSSKQVFTEASILDGIALNEWVYIESTIEDILSCDRLQFVIENNSNATIYVDDIIVTKEVSHNAYLEEVFLDTNSLVNFDKTVDTYVFLTDGTSVPQVTATASNPNAAVTVTQSTSTTGSAVIEVVAEDGTTTTYTITFTEPSSGLLSEIKLDGVLIDGFSATMNNYYIMLPSTTSEFPTFTATSMDVTDTVIVTPGTLPGYAMIEVTTTDSATNTYYVYVEVQNEDALSTPYPDVNFDKNLENWGLSSATDVTQSAEQFLNGSKSLKMIGGEAWLGLGFEGANYPVKGNSYSVGMWLYVDGTATSGFRVRLLEKDNNLELVNNVLDIAETGKWVYVETTVSATNVSAAAGYLQIVITNETGDTVFVDGIRLITQEEVEVDPVDPVDTTETVFAIPSANLDFEVDNAWGFWAPDTILPAYDTIITRDTQSLKFTSGSAWVGFGFDGPDYPAKGDTVKLGFYVYVDSTTASSVGGFTIKLLEKEGPNGDVARILYTTSDGEFAMDEWVYVETTTATISMDPAYLQIVIEEGTDGTVYVDDISVIKVTE